MRYLLDTNIFQPILNYYYNDVFINFWNKFDEMVKNNNIISVREVYKELSNSPKKEFLKNYKNIFLEPNNNEIGMIKEMLKNPNFINEKSRNKISSGKPYADLYIIAKAKFENCTVVTDEVFTANAPKIPTICKYYNIDCINMHSFIRSINIKL
ncbi:DUF4411 family protein [uncultured Brachyspira sp.]|uniref:DUF4411 family protein n=1 Tax=uncultured Brachyspira sp. TaxID=221953 RepID=UPI00262B637B|nr:DUF4411 family protein [uncultured Brachyspira sp.]